MRRRSRRREASLARGTAWDAAPVWAQAASISTSRWRPSGSWLWGLIATGACLQAMGGLRGKAARTPCLSAMVAPVAATVLTALGGIMAGCSPGRPKMR